MVGAKLFFLPPYSSGLNLIERVFAKLKNVLHKAQQRTVEDKWRHIGKLFQCFAAYIRTADYALI